MTGPLPRSHDTARAPQKVRDSLAKLVQHGLSVGEMLAGVAEGEKAMAEAMSRVGVMSSALAKTPAEVREAALMRAAAHEAQDTMVARAEMIAASYERLTREVGLTVLLVERLDRGWSLPGMADGRFATAKQQIMRGIEDAIGLEVEDESEELLDEALTEGLESLDVEDELGDRPTDEIILEILRELGLAAEWLAELSANPKAAKLAKAFRAAKSAGDLGRKAYPPRRRPKG